MSHIHALQLQLSCQTVIFLNLVLHHGYYSSRFEKSSDGVVEGFYALLEPDGETVRLVVYFDEGDGFNAEVFREPMENFFAAARHKRRSERRRWWMPRR